MLLSLSTLLEIHELIGGAINGRKAAPGNISEGGYKNGPFAGMGRWPASSGSASSEKNHECRYKKSLFAGMGYRERKKGGLQTHRRQSDGPIVPMKV